MVDLQLMIVKSQDKYRKKTQGKIFRINFCMCEKNINLCYFPTRVFREKKTRIYVIFRREEKPIYITYI